MYNQLINYLIVLHSSSPDKGVQNNEKTDTTPAIPDIIARTTRNCCNDRIKLAKPLAKNMKTPQKHLNNICTGDFRRRCYTLFLVHEPSFGTAFLKAKVLFQYFEYYFEAGQDGS